MSLTVRPPSTAPVKTTVTDDAKHTWSAKTSDVRQAPSTAPATVTDDARHTWSTKTSDVEQAPQPTYGTYYITASVALVGCDLSEYVSSGVHNFLGRFLTFHHQVSNDAAKEALDNAMQNLYNRQREVLRRGEIVVEAKDSLRLYTNEADVPRRFVKNLDKRSDETEADYYATVVIRCEVIGGAFFATRQPGVYMINNTPGNVIFREAWMERSRRLEQFGVTPRRLGPRREPAPDSKSSYYYSSGDLTKHGLFANKAQPVQNAQKYFRNYHNSTFSWKHHKVLAREIDAKLEDMTPAAAYEYLKETREKIIKRYANVQSGFFTYGYQDLMAGEFMKGLDTAIVALRDRLVATRAEGFSEPQLESPSVSPLRVPR
jgi:hypothetical protein